MRNTIYISDMEVLASLSKVTNPRNVARILKKTLLLDAFMRFRKAKVLRITEAFFYILLIQHVQP